jgi:hypothetical protein
MSIRTRCLIIPAGNRYAINPAKGWAWDSGECQDPHIINNNIKLRPECISWFWWCDTMSQHDAGIDGLDVLDYPPEDVQQALPEILGAIEMSRNPPRDV